jgi:hypothetical protein
MIMTSRSPDVKKAQWLLDEDVSGVEIEATAYPERKAKRLRELFSKEGLSVAPIATADGKLFLLNIEKAERG